MISLTLITRYGRTRCHAPISPLDLPLPNPTPTDCIRQILCEKCVFCYAATPTNSALIRTRLETIQSLPMRYFRTHGEQMSSPALSGPLRPVPSSHIELSGQ